MLPYSPDAALASPADRAACREAIKTGSRTFYAASLILPAAVREPAYGLYAFCRLSDDAIDLGGGSLAALDRLRDRLERAYAGRPLDHPADRAFADFLRAYCVPRALPEALLEGLGWDAEGRRYETIEDLHAYAARVAGTVGAMMTLMMGARARETLARACDLGVAMQLTNIARDVGEDARAGRVYLPLSWLREAGLDPDAFLADPVLSPALRGVVARLLRHADALYARARSGVADLGWECRPAILAAANLYAEIGREIERGDLDSIHRRARVSGARKLRVLARAVAASPWIAAVDPSPPLAAVRFLVDAVASAPMPARKARAAREPVGEKVGRVLDMFQRLERAEQFGK
jgi:phytoene synthase